LGIRMTRIAGWVGPLEVSVGLMSLLVQDGRGLMLS
jgi:hypothetical protein